MKQIQKLRLQHKETVHVGCGFNVHVSLCGSFPNNIEKNINCYANLKVAKWTDKHIRVYVLKTIQSDMNKILPKCEV